MSCATISESRLKLLEKHLALHRNPLALHRLVESKPNMVTGAIKDVGCDLGREWEFMRNVVGQKVSICLIRKQYYT